TGRKSTLDFKNPDAVRTLNKALLRVYFDLDVTIPNESLCPPVANRLNYIKWIKSNIIAEFWPGYSIRGLDIGTGASCIYPLLGARVLANSSFIGTDVNSTSIAVANQNIAANSLENRIQTYLNTDRQTKLPIDNSDFPINWDADADGSVLLFNMCNPPFYDSPEERQRLRDTKSIGQPSLDINGKDDELYTEGGEEMFLSGLVDESAVYQKRIKWYSTMIGKKKTLALLKTKIRSVGAKHIKEGLLIQGRTTRWVLAWSF
ncbi:ribosomal RNA large subunit methyltransferase F-like protein, partial [Coemansia spiralis]